MDQTWVRGPIIGRGATATVSLASSISDPNRHIAIKSSYSTTSTHLRNEHHILSRTGRHPNLITCLGFDESDGVCNLLTEHLPGGTLADRIKRSEKGRLNEQQIRFYTEKILKGLEFLHANGVVHCDVKSENVLLGDDDGSVKIADLGFSKLEGLVKVGPEFSGTPAFMAPEVARGEAQGFEADVWALGCTVIEMATGKNPWPEETNPVSGLYRIGFSGDIPTIPASLSDEGRDFVAKCLTRDPNERLTARELGNQPFVADSNVVEPLMKKIRRSSPTCVLDLAFWDRLDAEEQHDDEIDDVGNSWNSGYETIRRLDSGPPSTSCWSFDDENWITVRTNRTHHIVSQFSVLVGSDKFPLSADDVFVLLNPKSTSDVQVGRAPLGFFL